MKYVNECLVSIVGTDAGHSADYASLCFQLFKG